MARNFGPRSSITGAGAPRNMTVLEMRRQVEKAEIVVDCKGCGVRLMTISQRDANRDEGTTQVLIAQAIKKHQRETECVSDTQVKRIEKGPRA